MIKFENTEVIGWKHAIRGMRNPMNSWDKSDSLEGYLNPGPEYIMAEYSDDYEFDIGPNDQKLMMNLRNAGTDHRKFMRMITVYVDITAPLYWWKEFDTYKVGTVANSCSTMHKIAAKEFTLNDFSCEHLFNSFDDFEKKSTVNLYDSSDIFESDPEEYEEDILISLTPKDVLETTVKALNNARNGYLEAEEKLRVRDLTESEKRHVTSQKKKFWWQMIQLLPSSYNQKRTVMMNYEVLANIYKSRKNHKLDEWCEHNESTCTVPDTGECKNSEEYLLCEKCNVGKGFCDWIKTLPYSELITGRSKFCDKEFVINNKK